MNQTDTPLIFNIQRYSTHDGDGIRTTVFFKGCPLRCRWCHNPEGQKYTRELVFYAGKCIGCGECVSVCPRGANRLEAGTLALDRTKCAACGACEDVCPAQAREIAGQIRSVAELVAEAKKDRMFYEQSGGGVTLSGGEVLSMAEMDFVFSLCRMLKEEGISVLIDTSGYTDWERLERLVPLTDGFLYDLKLMDPAAHKAWIGTDNALILENLRRLARTGAVIDIRIPLIMGANGDEGFLRDVIRFLKEEKIRPRRIHLLPYHNTGRGKYAALGRPYAEDGMGTPAEAEMETFLDLFRAEGFSNVIKGG